MLMNALVQQLEFLLKGFVFSLSFNLLVDNNVSSVNLYSHLFVMYEVKIFENFEKNCFEAF